MKLSNAAKIFKALSNEQRLKIFLMIYKQCCCSGRKGSGTLEGAFTKACGCVDVCRSTISHHIKELQNAGLIICERKGQSFCCRVNEDALDQIKDFFE